MEWTEDLDDDGWFTGTCESPGSPHYGERRNHDDDGCEFFIIPEDLLGIDYEAEER
jgi:hypothetical protein